MKQYYEDENGEWVPVKKPPTLKSVIRSVLLESLAFSGGNQKKAAEVLGISPRMMNHKMKRYGIPRDGLSKKPEKPSDT